MQVIENNLERTGKKFTCDNCGSILLCNKTDIYERWVPQYSFYESLYWVFRCPVCGKQNKLSENPFRERWDDVL